MSRTVKELLADPLKGTNRAQGVLCYLFRHVLLWRKVNQFTWNKRARLYFEKPHNRDNPDKGNLNKALTHDDFTWGTFKKSIDFLNPYSATLVVQLTWTSGRVSRYPIRIDPAENEADSALNSFGEAESDVFHDQRKPASTLARLFRRIVSEEQIDVTRWQALFEDYAKNPLHGIPQNRRDITNFINTTQRELMNARMSWNVFRKGLVVLNPKQEDYILELRWSKDPTDVSIHTVTIRNPMLVNPASNQD
jgi:hypothetical protein